MILVTGGTGLVGARILLYLLKENSSILSIYRSNRTLENVNFFFKKSDPNHPELFKKITWKKADLNDVFSLEKVFKGVDKIYHCAAKISFSRKDRNKLFQTNITGTANIVNLAVKFKLKKIVFISSIASIGVEDNDDIVNEDSSWNNNIEHTDYAYSKYRSELEIWRGVQEGLPAIILNPGIILGSHFWNRSSGVLFTKISKKIILYPTGKTGVVSVEDVAKAAVKLMESKIINERFILVSKNISYKDLYKSITNVLNKKNISIPLYKWILYLFLITEQIFVFFKIKKKIMSIALIKSFCSNQHYDGTKITKSISFSYKKIEEEILKISEDFKLK